MTSDQKSLIRTEALRTLARLERGTEDAETVCRLFFEEIRPQAGQIVSAYWPQPLEFDVHPILERLRREGIPVALPAIQKDSLVLRFSLFDSNTGLKKNHRNVYEPAMNPDAMCVEPDIMILPLLAFDRRGMRLGRGGGYFDATLEYLRACKPVTAVGVAYGQQACLFNLPAEPHDQRLDWVITPGGAQYFGS